MQQEKANQKYIHYAGRAMTLEKKENRIFVGDHENRTIGIFYLHTFSADEPVNNAYLMEYMNMDLNDGTFFRQSALMMAIDDGQIEKAKEQKKLLEKGYAQFMAVLKEAFSE